LPTLDVASIGSNGNRGMSKEKQRKKEREREREGRERRGEEKKCNRFNKADLRNKNDCSRQLKFE